ncbi:MAG: hypothetical protein U0670_07180 [Anaerolineae bacterium]
MPYTDDDRNRYESWQDPAAQARAERRAMRIKMRLGVLLFMGVVYILRTCTGTSSYVNRGYPNDPDMTAIWDLATQAAPYAALATDLYNLPTRRPTQASAAANQLHTAIAMTQPTRTPALNVQGTSTAAARHAFMVMPLCSRSSPSNVIVFAVTVQIPAMGHVMRVFPDGSNLCQMPNTAISADIVALDADGRGAVVQYGTFLQHIDFFSEEVRPVYSAVESTPVWSAPDGAYRIAVRDGELFIESTAPERETLLDLPPEVTSVLMAQWVGSIAALTSSR